MTRVATADTAAAPATQGGPAQPGDSVPQAPQASSVQASRAGYDTVLLEDGDTAQDAPHADAAAPGPSGLARSGPVMQWLLWAIAVLGLLAAGFLLYWMSQTYSSTVMELDERGMARVAALAKQADRIGEEAKDVVTQPGIPPSMQATAEQLLVASNWLQDEVVRLRAERSNQSPLSLWHWLALVALLLLFAGAASGIVYLRMNDRRLRLSSTRSELDSVMRSHLDAERINQANQAAILRLMDELQNISEGDLTREATVTEDITGAIADSINYTVEELRALVRGVQHAATSVAQTTGRLESGSIDLLKTATKQLRDIRKVGQAILDMATGITTMSERAQQAARVADHSQVAATTGLEAVQATISGMEGIRTGIQETAKRMKRLGESSQEIGEMTGLIASITEQTNLLAMNAAIQAASAGEAGRGFAVVAEEVQRLAERSADATGQISGLVEAIQTDTQNAVVAMERCTLGVVQGTRLSDKAGAALSEIDRVSRELAGLIQEISASALDEAEQANTTAGNIQEIFAGTEQTERSVRNSAVLVGELSRIAEELRESASRFKTA